MRALNATALALLSRIESGEQIPAVQLVEFGFTPTERYTTAGVQIVWGGYTWLPLGLGIEPVDDSAGDMPGLTFALPGVSEAVIAQALNSQVEGVSVRVYDALVDPQSAVVADAVLAWSGTLNVPGIEDGPRATVNMGAEHRGALALRPKASRYTHDEQSRLYPGDTALKFDPATDAAPLAWPAASYFRR